MSYFNVLIVIALISIAGIITFIFKQRKVAIISLIIACMISGFILGVLPSPAPDYKIVVNSQTLKELKQGDYYSVDNKEEKVYVEVTRVDNAYTPILFDIDNVCIVVLEEAPPTLTVAYKKYENTVKNYLFYSQEVKNSRKGNHEVIEAEIMIPKK